MCPPFESKGRTDLDTHADTGVVGSNALFSHDYGRTVNVCGYDPSKGATSGPPVISAAIAHVVKEAGEDVMLVTHQAIGVPTIKHNLSCPFQLGSNDVMVNNCPRMFESNPTEESHSIIATDQYGDKYQIPLSLHNVTSCFSSRKPPLEEHQACDNTVELTSEEPEWDPHDPVIAREE